MENLSFDSPLEGIRIEKPLLFSPVFAVSPSFLANPPDNPIAAAWPGINDSITVFFDYFIPSNKGK